MLTLKSSEGPHGRTQVTLDHLRKEGIEVELFYGVDGRKSGLITSHTYELDHPGTGYRMGAKVVNLFLSHVLMWRVWEYLSGDSLMIFEDDVRFVPGWRDHFDFAWPALPSDWDILYVGSCCCMDKPGRQQVSGQLYRIREAMCTHAYAIRKKALPALLDATEKVYANVDIAMSLHALPRLNAYAFLPRLAEQFKTEIAP